ncbi:MAG: glycosyltransferase [Gammaproteobacteria bacterium]|nr:glycosyltransferase [Gammaproteobacteria bacterium]
MPSTAKIHVLHLLPRLNQDGTTHMVATLLKGLDRKNYRVTLCGLSPGNADLAPLYDYADEIVVLGMRHFFDFSALVPLYRLLKRLQVDIVHTHRIRPDILGRIAGTLAQVPVNISTQHYVDEWSERGAFVYHIVRTLFRATMGFCQSVACNSAAEQEVLLQKIGESYRSRCCVIHNGLDIDRFNRPSQAGLAALREALTLPPGSRVITSVAFLTERKGHRYLLEAIAQLLPAFPDIQLLLVGDGPEKATLIGQTESLGIAHHTRFLGNRDDVPELLALSELSVLPSLWEPFGLAALEAMAVETPVVVTDVGGLPEFVTHGKEGFLVPPADARALAESMGRMLSDTAATRSMGQAARTLVTQQFSARHVAQAYEQLYLHCLADSGQSTTL